MNFFFKKSQEFYILKCTYDVIVLNYNLTRINILNVNSVQY